MRGASGVCASGPPMSRAQFGSANTEKQVSADQPKPCGPGNQRMASEEYFCCKTVVDAYDPGYNQLKKSTTASVASVTGSRNGCDHIPNRISKSRKFFLTMSNRCQVSLPSRSRLGEC